MKKTHDLWVGVGQRDITPSWPVELQGHLNRIGNTQHVMDPVFTRVLVLGPDTTRVSAILVQIDVLGVDHDLLSEIRQLVSQLVPVQPADVVVTTSHTHTAPAAIRLGTCEPDLRFRRRIVDQVGAAVNEASSRRVPAGISVASSFNNRFGMNRRFPAGSRVVMKPNPLGAVDPEILVAVVTNQETRVPIAILVNVTMHPTVLGVRIHAISGDYPNRLARKLSETVDGVPMVIVLQGCAGDVKPVVRFGDTSFSEGTEEDIEHIGHELTQQATALAHRGSPVADVTCTYTSTTCTTRYAKPIKDMLFDVRDEGSDGADEWEKAHFDDSLLIAERTAWGNRMQELLHAGKLPTAPTAEVGVLRFGSEFAVAFLPGEPFASIGLNLKRTSPAPFTMVAGHSFGTIGYLPSKENADEPGYETQEAFRFYGLPCALHRETATVIKSAVVALLRNSSTEQRGGGESAPVRGEKAPQ
ncbi:MAG: hypothetical protein EA403_05410 [Spirochaetaceae bacterium]|nr:MAG: hypothetical protein EA403_05410 [Spirochaetaceae bacterium]